MNQFELTKTIINNLRDLDLTPSEQLVLIHLAQYDYVKQKTIIERSGLSKSTVIEAYKVLKEKGILNKKSEIQTSRFKIQTLKVQNSDPKSPNSGPAIYNKNNYKNNNKINNFKKNNYSEQVEEWKKNASAPTEEFLKLRECFKIKTKEQLYSEG